MARLFTAGQKKITERKLHHLEDGAVFAAVLCAEGSPDAAVQRYESLRLNRTAMAQRGARRNTTVFHFSGIAASARNLVVGRFADKAMDELYSYHAL